MRWDPPNTIEETLGPTAGRVVAELQHLQGQQRMATPAASVSPVTQQQLQYIRSSFGGTPRWMQNIVLQAVSVSHDPRV